MYSSTAGQRRIDMFVFALALLLAMALLGMLVGDAVLTTIPLPLMIFILTLMAVLGPDNRWPDRGTLTTITAFHVVSTVLWLVAIATRGDDTITIGGLPTSTGVLVLLVWPLYALMSGPMYAVCAERMRLTKLDLA